MNIMVETKYNTIFNIEEIYNAYLEFKYEYEKRKGEITLSGFLDYLEEVYKEQGEYEELVAFKQNRERIYDLLTKERKVREGPQNLEV